MAEWIGRVLILGSDGVIGIGTSPAGGARVAGSAGNWRSPDRPFDLRRVNDMPLNRTLEGTRAMKVRDLMARALDQVAQGSELIDRDGATSSGDDVERKSGVVDVVSEGRRLGAPAPEALTVTERRKSMVPADCSRAVRMACRVDMQPNGCIMKSTRMVAHRWSVAVPPNRGRITCRTSGIGWSSPPRSTASTRRWPRRRGSPSGGPGTASGVTRPRDPSSSSTSVSRSRPPSWR